MDNYLKLKKELKAPSLNISNYGNSINDLIDNIEYNFTKLANHDFVKGDKGNSIHIKTINLENYPDIVNQLKNAVSNLFINEPQTINGVHVYDFFATPGSISLIYEVIDGEDVLISSLPYTFKDLRFQNLSELNIEEYDNEVDCSCVICYDQGSFTAVQIFPTVYYDSDLKTFCWIINGIKTGLEAQGPRGFEGKAGVFKNVIAVKEDEYSDVYKITHILYKGEWRNVIDHGFEDIDHAGVCELYELTEGIPVMVVVEDGDENLVYLSEAYKDTAESTGENQLLVICNQMNQIFDVTPISNVEEICNNYWNQVDAG